MKIAIRPTKYYLKHNNEYAMITNKIILTKKGMSTDNSGNVLGIDVILK